MARNLLLTLWACLCCIQGSVSEVCYDIYGEVLTCIFGCCAPDLNISCCLSDKFDILLGAIVLVTILYLIIQCCIRIHRCAKAGSHPGLYSTVATNDSVTV
ncbi:uncharacterized protein LOC124144523 [Haliotis rufescens]|uniref:uncharacterized protein LOC124144523 n=1 Tax=Haliotis rufescens TaxID=6454 RepID=UPI00201F6E4C|nr:uncharacterized protein LOC124144523 [Haliotis rufescens]